ncbi:hypothetical protein Pyn_09474 [Prunus yedoensis var. nudiflora]|uniref:Uncharacterized protein n=1 Tax=Prunus yedoensis var. nudiflora TaxID=2094558 RepID=A0A314UDG4_PRUYE|nr:hypothetical protein Pyn_09474 [Prunus yedoensis var. nudiflora]
MDQNQTNVCACGDGCSDRLTYYAGKGVEVSSATTTQKPGHPMKWEFLRNCKLSGGGEQSKKKRQRKRGI